MPNTKTEDQEIESLYEKATRLAVNVDKDSKSIAVICHELLLIAPGETAKNKMQYIVEKFKTKKATDKKGKNKNSTDSYLRRLLHCAAFEVAVKLAPGTIKESQARMICGYTKDEQVRFDILERAFAISASGELKKPHVDQAIQEFEYSLNKHKND
ncbi:hypothetical protein [Methylomonas koyamae]|uniref:hypothetical protein n=1 Tax=Methylomonas koyamae TaxID=702114 RepID=UPI0028734928|nr:hypothetical protein [Methylomonas koyamae]WNB76752.1 hypothetical protein RI210_04040 [Methylomonas koyamae]